MTRIFSISRWRYDPHSSLFFGLSCSRVSESLAVVRIYGAVFEGANHASGGIGPTELVRRITRVIVLVDLDLNGGSTKRRRRSVHEG